MQHLHCYIDSQGTFSFVPEYIYLLGFTSVTATELNKT